MANLDTTAKRRSAQRFLAPYSPVLPLPDGTIGQADRQHLAWLYGGILAEAAAATAHDVDYFEGVYVTRTTREGVYVTRTKREGVY